MAVPQHRIDETRGLTLVTQDGESREVTRYLFTAGDVIDPDRKRQLATLRDGGEEVDARCLRRTPNYIPRCEITPFETWFEPLGIKELAGDSMKDLVSIGRDTQAELPPMVNPGQFFRAQEPMMGMPHYPGVDMGSLIDAVGYRGVKEIESLRGNEWEQGYVQREYQQVFFPADWEKPVALRLIEEQIRKVGTGSLRFTADELLASCDQFRHWALGRIGIENGLLQTRTKHNHTYSYSRLAPQLMAQLEVSPKDQGSDITNLAQELVKQLMAAQAPVVQAPILGQSVDLNAAIETAVKAALLAHGIGTPVVPAEYVCEGCGKSFDSPQGKSLHKTRHCKGDESESVE